MPRRNLLNSSTRSWRCSACSAILLFDERVRHRDLVLVQEIGQGAVALRRVTDDRRRLAVARTEPELLERGIDAVVLRRIDAQHGPVERREHALEIGHREDHAVRDVELTVVPVDDHAEIVEVLLAGVHHRFPDRPFLQLAVAGQAVRRRTEETIRPAIANPCATEKPCPMGPVATWTPGRSGPGCPLRMLSYEREFRSTERSKYPRSA